METILSSADCSSSEAVSSLLSICFPSACSILDATYGNGKFWSDSPSYLPLLTRSDKNPSRAADLCSDFVDLPFSDRAFSVAVFDPPFQPATTERATDVLIKRRFSKPVRGVDALKPRIGERRNLSIATTARIGSGAGRLK